MSYLSTVIARVERLRDRPPSDPLLRSALRELRERLQRRPRPSAQEATRAKRLLREIGGDDAESE